MPAIKNENNNLIVNLISNLFQLDTEAVMGQTMFKIQNLKSKFNSKLIINLF